jgi:hypothetical protein
MILKILNNILKEYVNTIKIFEEYLSGSRFSFQLLKDRIRSKHQRIQKEMVESTENVAPMTRLFTRMCDLRGIIGYKDTDCFKQEKNKDKTDGIYEEEEQEQLKK